MLSQIALNGLDNRRNDDPNSHLRPHTPEKFRAKRLIIQPHVALPLKTLLPPMRVKALACHCSAYRWLYEV